MTLVLPLVLRRLSPEEVAVWYLLSSIIALQSVADLGFAPSFARAIAYAMGGATQLDDLRRVPNQVSEPQPNWDLLRRIWGTAITVYRRIALIGIILFAGLGSLGLTRPISQLPNPGSGWFAWSLVCAASGIVLLGGKYAAFLQGTNEIALLRRWEALTTLAGACSSIAVLLLGGKLVALIAATQSWAVINVLRDRALASHSSRGHLDGVDTSHADKEVMTPLWSAAWRSGLGVAMSRGVTYSTGLIYAQFASGAAVASYMLAHRLLQTINELSGAPFYSKIPLLARLRSSGNVSEQVRVAARAMRISYWTYVTGTVALGLLATRVLQMWGSHTAFVPQSLWVIMVFAYLLERFGAMHLQLYSTTNHIVWHIANGVSGVITIAAMILLFPVVGVYAFPTGVALGYLGFYCWYSARYSYRAFQLRFWSFERDALLAPALVFIAYATFALTRH